MLKRLAAIDNIKGVKYTAATHFNFEKIKKEIAQANTILNQKVKQESINQDSNE